MSKDLSPLVPLGLAALALSSVQIVIAAEYLSIDQAQRASFPQADRIDESVAQFNALAERESRHARGPATCETVTADMEGDARGRFCRIRVRR